MKRPITVAVFIFLSAYGIPAQSPAPPSAFESAIVKISSPYAYGPRIHRSGPTHLAFDDETLRQTIAYAYQLPPRSVLGAPAWVGSARYDTVIDVPPSGPIEQLLPTVQAFLAARFKLQVHREQKLMPVYNLVVGETELKLKPSAEGENQHFALLIQGPPSALALPGRNASMGELADVIGRVILDRAIVDKTGLTGRYNFDLEWADPRSRTGGPDLLAAVQQLGLKLEPAQGLVDTVVVDYIEQPALNQATTAIADR